MATMAESDTFDSFFHPTPAIPTQEFLVWLMLQSALTRLSPSQPVTPPSAVIAAACPGGTRVGALSCAAPIPVMAISSALRSRGLAFSPAAPAPLRSAGGPPLGPAWAVPSPEDLSSRGTGWLGSDCPPDLGMFAAPSF